MRIESGESCGGCFYHTKDESCPCAMESISENPCIEVAEDGTKKYYIFDGPLLTEDDHKRLSRVLDKVRDLMSDGEWRTLGEIHRAIACSCEASISARLRDLRKKKFGSHSVDRRSREHGLWEYRMNRKGA